MLPDRRFEVVTELPPTEVHDRLAELVGPKVARARGVKADRPYAGMVLLASFEMIPNVDYRNRFLPCAEGRVVPNGTGSLVSVRIRLLPVTRALVVLMLVLASLAWVATIAAVVYDGILHHFAWPHLAPVVFVGLFPLLAVLAPRLGFRREAVPLEEHLRNALDPAARPPYR